MARTRARRSGQRRKEKQEERPHRCRLVLFAVFLCLHSYKNAFSVANLKRLHEPLAEKVDQLAAKVDQLTRQKELLNSSSNDDVVAPSSLGKLVVVGAARNVIKHLPRLSQDVANATKDFDVVQLVFFENDSNDGALEQLKSWNDTQPWQGKVHIMSESSVPGDRTEILACARNRIFQCLRQLATSVSFQYVLSVDLDYVSYNLRGVEECLSLPENWAVCCTNNYRWIYDLWALRTYDNWTDCDVMNDCSDCPSFPKMCFGQFTNDVFQRSMHACNQKRSTTTLML